MTELEIKAAVRARDGYTCADCGEPQVRRVLDVHRIIPGSLYTVEGCVALCRRCHKKRHGRLKTEGTEQVRVPVEVLRDAKIICAATGESLPALATRALRELLAREMAGAVDTINKRAKQLKHKPPPPGD